MMNQIDLHGVSYMDVFEKVDDETKSRIIERWKTMSESDKTHFINQVSLVLSVWGSDDRGKQLVVDILKSMVSNGSSTLADFGLYTDKALQSTIDGDLKAKIKRASLILDGYRIKNSLPSEPHKEIGI